MLANTRLVIICVILSIGILFSSGQSPCASSCNGIPNCACSSAPSLNPAQCCANNASFWSTATPIEQGGPTLILVLSIAPTNNTSELTPAQLGDQLIAASFFDANPNFKFVWPLQRLRDLIGTYDSNPDFTTSTVGSDGGTNTNTNSNTNTNTNGDGDGSPAIGLMNFLSYPLFAEKTEKTVAQRQAPSVGVAANGSVIFELTFNAYLSGFDFPVFRYSFVTIFNETITIQRITQRSVTQVGGTPDVYGFVGVMIDASVNQPTTTGTAFIEIDSVGITGEADQSYGTGSPPFQIRVPTVRGIFVAYAKIDTPPQNFTVVARATGFNTQIETFIDAPLIPSLDRINFSLLLLYTAA